MYRDETAAVTVIDAGRGVYAVTDAKEGTIHQFISSADKAVEYGKNFVKLEKADRGIVTAARNMEQSLERQGLKMPADGSFGEVVPGSQKKRFDGREAHTEVRAVFDGDGKLSGFMEWDVRDGDDDAERKGNFITAAYGGDKVKEYRDLLNLEDVPAGESPNAELVKAGPEDSSVLKLENASSVLERSAETERVYRGLLRNDVAKRIDAEQAEAAKKALNAL